MAVRRWAFHKHRRGADTRTVWHKVQNRVQRTGQAARRTIKAGAPGTGPGALLPAPPAPPASGVGVTAAGVAAADDAIAVSACTSVTCAVAGGEDARAASAAVAMMRSSSAGRPEARMTAAATASLRSGLSQWNLDAHTQPLQEMLAVRRVRSP